MNKRHQFTYEPQVPTQAIFQLLLVAGYLFWLETCGQSFWELMLQSFSFQQVWIGGGFLAYLFWFWAWATPYLILDQLQQPYWLYRHKIQKPGTAVTKRRLAWTVAVVLFNQFAGTLPVLYCLYQNLVGRGMAAFSNVPRWWTVLLHLALSLAMEEVLFFCVHYTLHSKFLYVRFHKMHHEYKESIAITTHYVHYVEHLFGNLMPIFAGTLLLGAQAHLLSLLLWILLAVQNALGTHSGYNFPWLNYAVDHDFHHYNYVGNYGVGLGMDWLFGTDVLEDTFGRQYKDQAGKKD